MRTPSQEDIERIKCLIPLNERIDEHTYDGIDNYMKNHEISRILEKRKGLMIEDMKRQIEDLTEIVNVLAPLVLNKTDKRKLGEGIKGANG